MALRFCSFCGMTSLLTEYLFSVDDAHICADCVDRYEHALRELREARAVAHEAHECATTNTPHVNPKD